MNPDELMLVLCAVPDEACGRRIADLLLQKKAAACVSMVPGVQSHYVWQGMREETAEVLLYIKSVHGKYAELELLIRSQHPYECPEIIGLPVTAGFGAYQDWVRQSVAGG